MQAMRPVEAEGPRQPDDNDQFQEHHTACGTQDEQRQGREDANVQTHSDRDQEHADGQAFERLDGDLDLTAVLRAGEQQAADQRAKRHRETGAAVARPTTITTSKQAATNNSAFRVRATLRNSGRNTKRPKATIAATVSSAWPTATPNVAMLLTRVVGANVPRTKSIGTTAKSWNSRMAKLVRPVAVLS